MATILVTGSNGQLGQALAARVSAYSGYEFVFSDIEQADISDPAAVLRLINEVNPSWVINCAAYTAVDRAEDEPAAAFAANAAGPANLAAALKGTDCKLIHISTDYIFDGSANKPYSESDAPYPQTVYGKSKLEGEVNALSHPRTIIIRTAWLYSEYGNNFVKTILRILNEGKEPMVVFDQTGSPTYAGGLADAILKIVSGVIRNKVTFVPGIYHYSDEGVCSWFDIAETISHLSGLKQKITPCLTEQFPTKAPRPAYTVLNKQKIRETYNTDIPYWRENLIMCLKNLI
ncbi:MAG: dTDP-4-dehydrorhamnose reductase [Bacteroidales bacterium]|nr:dTDP-4-dehydrorhamnose reductase [Bacteroidales bacterium]